MSFHYDYEDSFQGKDELMDRFGDNSFDKIVKTVCDADFINWDSFKDKTIVITGGTGLIGYTIIRSLIYASQEKELNIRLLAVVRNIEKAKSRFEGFVHSEDELVLVEGTVEALPTIPEKVDYIIHGASNTASKDFVYRPVETIETAVIGTMNVLKLAKEKKVSGFVYLSSMEVYGYPPKGHRVLENEMGSLSSLDVRNSYPISKIQCESLCKSYANEYDVPAVIARLTQTFGPGVEYNDGRIFAYMGRCIVEKQNIVLKTKGETERSYLHTLDAVTAVLVLLQKGIAGEAYNVANEKTYCSISEMAEGIAKRVGIRVLYDVDQSEFNSGYAKTLFMDLSTEKIKKLNWRVQFNGNTTEMIADMVGEYET